MAARFAATGRVTAGRLMRRRKEDQSSVLTGAGRGTKNLLQRLSVAQSAGRSATSTVSMVSPTEMDWATSIPAVT